MRMRMKQNMANTFMVNLLRWTFVLRQDRRHSFQAYHTSRPGLNAPGRRQSGEMGHAVDARHNFSNLRMFQLKSSSNGERGLLLFPGREGSPEVRNSDCFASDRFLISLTSNS